MIVQRQGWKQRTSIDEGFALHSARGAEASEAFRGEIATANAEQTIKGEMIGRHSWIMVVPYATASTDS